MARTIHTVIYIYMYIYTAAFNGNLNLHHVCVHIKCYYITHTIGMHIYVLPLSLIDLLPELEAELYMVRSEATT